MEPERWLSPPPRADERCEDPPESAPLPPREVPLPCVELPSVGPDSSFDGERTELRRSATPAPPSPSPSMPRHSRCTCAAWCGGDMEERLTPPLLPRLPDTPLLRLRLPSLHELPPLPPLPAAPVRRALSGRKKLPALAAEGWKC